MRVEQGQMLKRSDLRSVVAAVIDSFPASGAFAVRVLQANRRGAVTKPPRSGPGSRLFLHVLDSRAAESFTGSCIVKSLFLCSALHMCSDINATTASKTF